ncbi:hypothetical protein OBP_197 [Pseudomonas phage OBP]|uniref:hypothetical protein n=1 Tax=Pseudomonas phage OBP TaxID=1124849 RepID=UPI000240D5A5|nr:hypothetical protein OBP_197 [Pseudomonas phage OBP]AEV89634.1 hypothetical protein OBP_197 [Pseudomonas phage OBP]
MFDFFRPKPISKKKLFEIHHGTTRSVILFHKWAIKIPHLKSYKGFLKGLLANMTERSIWHCCPNYFLPVIWSMPLGLVVVMPRVKATKQVTWYLHAFMADLFHANNDDNDEALNARRYCEYIPSNVAMYKGKPVCIDYGTYIHPDVTEKELDGEMYYLKLKTRNLVEEKFGPQDWSHYGNQENILVVQESAEVCLELLDIPTFTANVESKDRKLPHGLLAMEKANEGSVIRVSRRGSAPGSESLGDNNVIPRNVPTQRRPIPVEAIQTTVVLN